MAYGALEGVHIIHPVATKSDNSWLIRGSASKWPFFCAVIGGRFNLYYWKSRSGVCPIGGYHGNAEHRNPLAVSASVVGRGSVSTTTSTLRG